MTNNGKDDSNDVHYNSDDVCIIIVMRKKGFNNVLILMVKTVGMTMMTVS